MLLASSRGGAPGRGGPGRAGPGPGLRGGLGRAARRHRALGQFNFRTRSISDWRKQRSRIAVVRSATPPPPGATNGALTAYRSAASTWRIGKPACVESSDGIPVGDSTIMWELAGAPRDWSIRAGTSKSETQTDPPPGPAAEQRGGHIGLTVFRYRWPVDAVRCRALTATMALRCCWNRIAGP